MRRGANRIRSDVILTATDVVGVVEVPSRDCGDKGTVNSSVEGVLEVLFPNSAGIVRNSPRDCCNEGTLNSSDKSAGETGVVGEGTVEISDCAEGVTSSYPDPPSVRIISGAPSVESRRGQLVAVTLVRI